MRIIFFFSFCLIFILTGCAGSAFQEAQKLNSVKAYDQFLAKHEDSEFSEKAKEARENVFYKNIKIENSVVSYERYLKEYPNGKYLQEAKELLSKAKIALAIEQEEDAFDDAKRRKSVKDFDEYLEKYPQGKHIDVVKELLEEAIYTEAKEKLSTELKDRYFREYPNGKYTFEMKVLNEKILFAKKTEKPFINGINVVWESADGGKSFYYDENTNLLWTILPSNMLTKKYKSSSEVGAVLSNLSISGLKGWRLPVFSSDIKQFNDRKGKFLTKYLSMNTFFVSRGINDDDDCVLAKYNLKNYNRRTKKYNPFYCSKCYSRNSCGVGIGVRNATEIDLFIKNTENKPLIEKFSLTVTSILNDKFDQIDSSFPIKPSEPNLETIAQIPVLTKGEFETSNDFEERKKVKEMKTFTKREKILRDFQNSIIDYENLLQERKNEYLAELKRMNQEDIFKSMVKDSSQEALNYILGDPIFTDNVVYNADSQEFDIVIKSMRGDYNEKVTVPVGISKAKSFKKEVLNTNLVPSIEFNILADNMKFVKLSFITNDAKIDQDFQFLLSFHLIWKTVFAQDAGILWWLDSENSIKAVDKIRHWDIHLSDIPSILNSGTDFLMWFAGTVAVVFIIIWAYKTNIWSLSNQKSAWKETILLALGGFVVASCAWVIMRIVIDNFS